ncbi:MAG: hypothetical protein JWO31_2432, partial [Phycisphaerales bacterium]|nr:hypothetical protein [Phycisphaerales bacterium]
IVTKAAYDPEALCGRIATLTAGATGGLAVGTGIGPTASA